MSFKKSIENRLQDKGELTTKAILLLKTYLQCGCNKRLTAKKLNQKYGDVYHKLHSNYVRNIFKHILIEKGITFDELALKLKEGLNADKKILHRGKIKSLGADYYAREKYLKDCLSAFEIDGKKEEESKGSQVIIVNYGYRNGNNFSAIRIEQEREAIPAYTNPAESS